MTPFDGLEPSGLPKGSRLTVHHDTEGHGTYALWYSNRRSIDPYYHVVVRDEISAVCPVWIAVDPETGTPVGEGPSIPEAILNALRNEGME